MMAGVWSATKRSGGSQVAHRWALSACAASVSEPALATKCRNRGHIMPRQSPSRGSPNTCVNASSQRLLAARLSVMRTAGPNAAGGATNRVGQHSVEEELPRYFVRPPGSRPRLERQASLGQQEAGSELRLVQVAWRHVLTPAATRPQPRAPQQSASDNRCVPQTIRSPV
jgi:hypothetical protein